jgi:hypothetical protein
MEVRGHKVTRGPRGARAPLIPPIPAIPRAPGAPDPEARQPLGPVIVTASGGSPIRRTRRVPGVAL